MLPGRLSYPKYDILITAHVESEREETCTKELRDKT
jgi:hypothetical protein